MALRFDLPDLMEDFEEEQESYDSEPCFPYPIVDGLLEEVAMRRLAVNSSLIRLNIRGAPVSTRLRIGFNQNRGRKKVLLKLP
ncbi:hypothetical protein [Endozoicomonas numazuensis]|uniref:Uncharacterized protein n=1 Tax=Endozoicomonas numazuensis TaxID=1137799 RepID=A0A081NKZ6_9GAMM|nr:hypothetical protein [Endozoicomonas numazuensis]KEQ19119.1 hypothetical protein GZ78_03690 [Endozoicomonas numazuensis]